MPAVVSSGSSSEWIAPLPTLDGRAWNLGFELDTAQILDPTHATLGPEDARAHLFAAIDPALASLLASEDVIVAEAIVGTTATARPALASLAQVGIRVLVARMFVAAVTSVGRELGVATVVVDTPNCLHTHDRLRLDFDTEKIVNLSSGDRVPMRNIDDVERAALRSTLAVRTAD
ncbi:MAG: hypothetical protein ABIR79_13465 [Candidatus Binatia bacterium]